MNIVLDTNCLLISISKQSEYHQIWQDFLDGKCTLCITNEIIEEYSEVLSRNISPLVSELFVFAILNRRNVKKVSPSFSFHLIEADVDDNKFVDCAIVANAKYIVTEDHHYDVLNILVLRNAFEKTRKQMKVNALSINVLRGFVRFPMFAELTLKKT